MKRQLVLPAITAAVLALIPSAPAQAVDSVESIKNRAVAVSPRAQEAFPSLARQTAPRSAPQATVARGLKNQTVVASPRALEVFPERGRTFIGKSGSGSTELTDAKSNSALLASPRTLEQFPSLSRDLSFDGGTAKGGASRL